MTFPNREQAPADLAGLIEEVGPQLRSYQALDSGDVDGLVASIEAEVWKRRRANGTMGPVAPLHFELNRFDERGRFLEEHEEGEWEVALDREGRVVREGPQLVYLYSPTHVDTLTILNGQRIGSVRRSVLDGQARVRARVTLDSAGEEFNAYVYDWVEGRLTGMRWWAPGFGNLYAYSVEHTQTGEVERVTLGSGKVVYERPKTPRGTLFRMLEAEVTDAVRRAVADSSDADHPLRAMVLTCSGSSHDGLYPPTLWLGSDRVWEAFEQGDAAAEELWNPLLDALPLAPAEFRAEVTQVARELEPNEVDALFQNYRRWSRRWTKELREDARTADDFVVIVYDPEYEDLRDVLKAAFSQDEFTQMETRGAIPS